MLSSPVHGRLPVVGAVIALAVACGCFSESNDAPTAPRAGTGTSAAAGKAAPPVAPNWVAEPRWFAAGARITSFAATPNRLLGATVGPAPAKLVTFSESGAIAAFAPQFVLPQDQVCVLDRAPGVGAFAFDAIVVGSGSDLWQIHEDDATALPLASLPAADGAIVQLCFDTIGDFDFDLLVLCESGGLFRVGANGWVERIGDAGPGARGLAIATNRFAALAGRVLVAVPAIAEVRSMSPAGQWTLVTRWSGVTGVWSIPDDPRAFGSTGGALFLATDAGEVHRFPMQDIAARAGQVVLTSEQPSGSGLIVPQGRGWMTCRFSRFVGREVSAGVVRRPHVQRVGVDVWPGAPAWVITQGSDALIPVGVLSQAGFVPAILESGEVTLAGAAPVPYRRRRVAYPFDLNADGVLDLVYWFRASDLPLVPGDCTLQLDGVAFGGDRVRGSDRILVVAP